MLFPSPLSITYKQKTVCAHVCFTNCLSAFVCVCVCVCVCVFASWLNQPFSWPFKWGCLLNQSCWLSTMGGPAEQWEVFCSYFSGGLGVASACSTDAAQINICLFSLTPSPLVLKGELWLKFWIHISRNQKNERCAEGGLWCRQRWTCQAVDESTAPAELLLAVHRNHYPQKIPLPNSLAAADVPD